MHPSTHRNQTPSELKGKWTMDAFGEIDLSISRKFLNE
jgi:hypothetical protein